jgi:hypothetical protein
MLDVRPFAVEVVRDEPSILAGVELICATDHTSLPLRGDYANAPEVDPLRQ